MKRPKFLDSVDELLFALPHRPEKIAIRATDMEKYKRYADKISKAPNYIGHVTKTHYMGVPIMTAGIQS